MKPITFQYLEQNQVHFKIYAYVDYVCLLVMTMQLLFTQYNCYLGPDNRPWVYFLFPNYYKVKPGGTEKCKNTFEVTLKLS